MAKKTAKKEKTKKEQRSKVCPDCGEEHPIRKNLGANATREEVESLILINNRIKVAAQVAQPTNTSAAPEQVQVFLDAALNAKAEALNMQRQWWVEITNKYKLTKDKNIFVDFETGEFYVLE